MKLKPDWNAEMDALKPMAKALRRMQTQLRPFGRDYLAVMVALQSLDETAEQLTGRRHVFGAQHDTVGPIRP
jgi:hypothetical protein